MKGVARVWRGYTRPENAEAFERFLKDDVFPDFERNLQGYQGGQLLKRNVGNEVEFMTVMWFDSLDFIKLFAGVDYETAHIDPKVKNLLVRYDAKSLHGDVVYSSI